MVIFLLLFVTFTNCSKPFVCLDQAWILLQAVLLQAISSYKSVSSFCALHMAVFTRKLIFPCGGLAIYNHKDRRFG
jgi:hypothetical protein